MPQELICGIDVLIRGWGRHYLSAHEGGCSTRVHLVQALVYESLVWSARKGLPRAHNPLVSTRVNGTLPALPQQLPLDELLDLHSGVDISMLNDDRDQRELALQRGGSAIDFMPRDGSGRAWRQGSGRE